MNRFFLFLCVFMLSFATMITAEPTPERLKVFVSILPQIYFVEQIGGELVDVEVLVGPGMSPHTYEPLPKQMGRLSRASILFTIGVPFEEAIKNRIVSLCPDLKVVETDKNVERRFMLEHESINNHDHQHGEDCDHGSGTSDPHIWLDPQLAIIQGENIAIALKESLPMHAKTIDKRFRQFIYDMHSLTEEIIKKLEPVKGQKMLVFHPAFGYFADRFGLKQIPIEIAGKEPAPKQLVDLIRMCKREKISVVFVQEQFPAASAETVARSIHGAVVKINPLSADYANNLRHIADGIVKGLARK